MFLPLLVGNGLLCLYLTYYVCYAAVLINLPIMLKIMLKNKYCALSIITTSTQISLNKSLLIADNVESLF